MQLSTFQVLTVSAAMANVGIGTLTGSWLSANGRGDFSHPVYSCHVIGNWLHVLINVGMYLYIRRHQ